MHIYAYILNITKGCEWIFISDIMKSNYEHYDENIGIK